VKPFVGRVPDPRPTPSSALCRRRGQLQSAFVVEGGISLRRLTLGQSRGGKVEILSSLTAGARATVEQVQSLSDGARVEVKP